MPNTKSRPHVNLILNLSIIFIVLFIVLYFSLKDNYQDIINHIQSMNPIWLIISIIILLISRALIGASSYLITKGNNCHVKLKRIVYINYIIPFFHGITPFSGGGQPMEVYYMHNEDIPIPKATNIVLQNFIVYQTALIIVGIFALTYNAFFQIFPTDGLINHLVVLGFTINFLVWLLSFLVSFSKRTNKFILDHVITFLSKIKLIKNIQETKTKLNNYLANFHENAIQLKKHKKIVIKALLLNILSLLILHSLPYTVIGGISGVAPNLINIIVATTYVMIIGSFVPIPGGTGGLEYAFIYFFDYIITNNKSLLTASMLMWRFTSYYLAMIIGAIFLAFYRKKVQKCE